MCESVIKTVKEDPAQVSQERSVLLDFGHFLYFTIFFKIYQWKRGLKTLKFQKFPNFLPKRSIFTKIALAEY